MNLQNNMQDAATPGALWMPPRSLLFEQESSIDIKTAHDCFVDCFSFLFGGKKKFEFELNICGLQKLLTCTPKEIDGRLLDNATEILRDKACKFSDPMIVRRSIRRLQSIVNRCSSSGPVEEDLPVKVEADISVTRKTAMLMAQAIGFSLTHCTNITTVVSELARNILRYAGEGKIVLTPISDEVRGKGMKIQSIDKGPGIPNVDEVLSGRYKSKTGMGMGIVGSKRLLDSLEVETYPNKGTRITGTKYVS